MKQSAISSIHQDSGSLIAVSARVQGKWWAFSHRQEATNNKGETNIMLQTNFTSKEEKKTVKDSAVVYNLLKADYYHSLLYLLQVSKMHFLL